MASDLRRPMILLAHPGQELRLHGWIHRGKPAIWIWTDGSGPDCWPRAMLHCPVIEGSAQTSGRDLHDAILRGSYSLIRETLHRITTLLEFRKPTDLITIAAEGINPVTDLLRHLTAMAVAEYREQGHRIEHWESCVEGAPVSVTPIYGRHVDLKDEEYESKLVAVESYTDLAPEYERFAQEYGSVKLRREVIYRALPWMLPPREVVTPTNEQLNPELTFADHLWPILEELDSNRMSCSAA